jgi:hypothetical protein
MIMLGIVCIVWLVLDFKEDKKVRYKRKSP